MAVPFNLLCSFPLLIIVIFLLIFTQSAHASPVKLGDSCTASLPSQCDSGCCLSGVCAPFSSCFGLKPPGEIGASCTASEVSQCISGCCYAGICKAAEECFGERPETMFVQTADSAKIYVRSSSETNSNTTTYGFELVLTNPGPRTTWFTDRPVRSGGSVSNELFLSVIGDTSLNPINAALLGYEEPNHEGHGPAKVLLVELAEGRVDKDKNDNSQQLRYLMRPLSSQQSNSRKSLVNIAKQGSGQPTSGTLSQPSLFLDDCPDSVDYYCCNQPGCTTIYDLSSDTRPSNTVSDYFVNVYNVVGEIAVSTCWSWSWSSLGCAPCRDLSSQCNQANPQYNGTLVGSRFQAGQQYIVNAGPPPY